MATQLNEQSAVLASFILFFSENAEMQKVSHLVLLFFFIIQKYYEAKTNDSYSEKDQVYDVSLD